MKRFKRRGSFELKIYRVEIQKTANTKSRDRKDPGSDY